MIPSDSSLEIPGHAGQCSSKASADWLAVFTHPFSYKSHPGRRSGEGHPEFGDSVLLCRTPVLHFWSPRELFKAPPHPLS